jgi:predicted transglutaminase-like cysteine proteinase
MNRINMLAGLAMAMAAVPATAAPGDSKATATSPAAAADKSERKICKSIDHSASRLKREKVCLTREEWKKFNAVTE